MSEAFEAYGMFLALQRHFTSETYDYERYNGKVKTNYEKFLKRHDKYHFHRLSKREDPKNLILANVVKNPKVWVTDVMDAEGEKVYKDWKKRIDALTQNFKEDIGRLEGDFDSLLLVENGKYPKMLKYYQHGSISKESLMIVNEVTGAFKHWNNKIEDQLIWPELYFNMKKYRTFLQLESKRTKFIQIIIEKYS